MRRHKSATGARTPAQTQTRTRNQKRNPPLGLQNRLHNCEMLTNTIWSRAKQREERRAKGHGNLHIELPLIFQGKCSAHGAYTWCGAEKCNTICIVQRHFVYAHLVFGGLYELKYCTDPADPPQGIRYDSIRYDC